MKTVAEIFNLNKLRKTHNRKQKVIQTNINRAKFGQTKVQKIINKSELQRDDKEFMGKQLDNDGPDVE